MNYDLQSAYSPAGDQPQAIEQLSSQAVEGGMQTLMGVTGSGKSLAYGEPILVKDSEGFISRLSIGGFVEENLKKPKTIGSTKYQKISGLKILSFNPNTYSIEEKEIREVSKHKEEFLYEITLDDFSKIKVTKDHNCFKLMDCELVLCKTNELRVGDHLPLPTFIPESSLHSKTLDLTKYHNGKYDVSKLFAEFDPKCNILRKVLKHGSVGWKIGQIKEKTKERGVSSSELKQYLKALNLDLQTITSKVYLITKGKSHVVPFIKIDRDFLRFAGLYVAEGHNTGKYLLLSNSDENLQKKNNLFWKKLGLNYCIRNENDIQYNSIVLAEFFKGFGSTAKTKRIPSFVYNLSNSDLGIFLSALFDGDGWAEPNSIHILSASEELIYQIKELLLRFSITSRITVKKIKYLGKYRNFLQLNISGGENLERFKNQIGFSIGYKHEKLRAAIKSIRNTNVDLVPGCGPFIKNIRTKLNLSQKQIAGIMGCRRSYISMLENGQREVSKKLFLRFAKYVGIQNPEYSYLIKLCEFNFRKIVSIKQIKNKKKFVYDLAVKDNENFIAGRGLIFVHNTFTMASVIAKTNKPAIIISHNKTLAAQLYSEFQQFFPKNNVGYFVSYYDYYQPESYISQTDTYIEKSSDRNAQLDQFRMQATSYLLSNEPTVIVASVSCIYGLGNPSRYKELGLTFTSGQSITRDHLLDSLINMQYARNDAVLDTGKFRLRGDTLEVFPPFADSPIRVVFDEEQIERIEFFDLITGKKRPLQNYLLLPAKHFVIPEHELKSAVTSIRAELNQALPGMDPLEHQRLEQKTNYDLEMIDEVGYCSGIENYSRHFDGRSQGERPYCLLDYFPDDFLMFIDESHVTLPQIRGMYFGDHARKTSLVENGFRLPSAYDNRPLKFEEFERFMKNVIFVSATPSDYEHEHSSQIVEQIVRPTGLIDPEVEVRKTQGQIDDLRNEIELRTKKNQRTLVTTLTKKMAEDLATYLHEKGVNVRYLHSEIDTLARTKLIRELRLGKFDCLVGINLLREGLDIPEVSLVAILDADKSGFLRSVTSLIQTIGRASRNAEGKVIMYADSPSPAMEAAIMETNRRRKKQQQYNSEHGIIPRTIRKPIAPSEDDSESKFELPSGLTKKQEEELIKELEQQMKLAAEELQFERAIKLREQLRKIKKGGKNRRN